MKMAFEDNKYAEAARREGGALTEDCLVFLAQQENGKQYLEAAIHSEGADYFERMFETVRELKKDYQTFEAATEDFNNE